MRIIRTEAHPRAAIAGNPSDGYGGRTIAFTFRDFAARVILYEWHEMEILLSENDRCRFPSLDALVEDVHHHGYYGGLRLVKASIKRFADHLRRNGIRTDAGTFSIRYGSDIPRQVGLAGSSAIVTATFLALCEFHGVEIDRGHLPSIVLATEREELGIAAGLQDRVAQVYGGLVYMDFAPEHFARMGHGLYEPMPIECLRNVYIAYRTDLSKVSGAIHGNLRARYDAGEPDVVRAIAEIAGVAAEAREALLAGRFAEVKRLMDRNVDLRTSLYDIGPGNRELVAAARAAGASANMAGSGGCIVGCYDDEGMFERLRANLERTGCRVLAPRIG
ncbi:MAG: GHMP kinase [Planctomycetes bacterium]|nr:GHMP kinase [Planctomycetota bacterium]